jgi:predicted ATP-dependent endonuclease of OLD family
MDQALQVLIENDDSEFTALAERSDGFRQFVALQAFIMKRRKRDPILLIDEAETHLHYDAQADLVQMLGRQKVAQKVIYTTHSAGCLPEDLGNGVRLVACDSDGSTSHIVNRFWGTKEPGFSPLLIGMGASTLAFFPTRRALMAEGETEMLLLPTLLREALAKAVVGFQVVPGTAKANKSLLPKATAKQSYIAYLVDADEAGGEIRRQLKKNGVEDGAIFSLPASEGEEREIEDFIEDSILIRSMNAIIEKFSPGASHSKMAKLPVFSKVDILSNEYKKITSKEMSKVDLSYEVLNIVSNSPGTKILCADKKEHFEKFSRDIEAFFSPRD